MRIESFLRRPVWRTLALLTLIGLVTGAVASRTMRTVYISTATLQIAGDSSASTQSSLTQALSRSRLTTLINELDLYSGDRKRKPLEDVVEQMRRDTRVSHVGEPDRSSAISVAFAHSDPRTAQRVTNELVADIIRDNAQGKTQGTLKLVDPANLPTGPASPNVAVLLSIGSLCGLLAGAMLAALTTRMRRLDHHSA